MRRQDLNTPCYIIDESALVKNLEILHRVEVESGAHVLLAQKCFSCFSEYQLIAKYISGTTASGLYEARLGAQEMARPFGTQNHVYSPAYRPKDVDELADICDHMIFNSRAEVERYADRVKGRTSIGLRINPEFSTQVDHAIYDPCAPGSRLGIRLCDLDEELVSRVEGFHFHTQCEQQFPDLKATVDVICEKFGSFLRGLKWINLGGGQHITKEGYDIEGLITMIKSLREKYGVRVYLEPGEAVALDAGYLDATVLDIVENGITTLILDASAACHMPDVLEMPYRPPVLGAVETEDGDEHDMSPASKLYTYRLSCNTCLAGDIIGDYSFDHEIKVGDRITFLDMAIYSMVKNNTFNGIPLPSIVAMDESGDCRVIKEFSYEDFKERLS